MHRNIARLTDNEARIFAEEENFTISEHTVSIKSLYLQCIYR